jgi:hypothetical protein
MKERINRIAGPETATVPVDGYLPFVFAKFLRYDGHHLGYKSNLQFTTQTTQEAFIRTIIRERTLMTRYINRPPSQGEYHTQRTIS